MGVVGIPEAEVEAEAGFLGVVVDTRAAVDTRVAVAVVIFQICRRVKLFAQ